jgi:hypothetical protein
MVLREKITRFDLSGLGLRAGTASGKINGASITTSKFVTSGFPLFTTNDRVGITDTDGDQIIFRVLGNGQFINPVIDPTVPGDTTAPPTQVLGGTGSTVSGIFEVVATSGKYTRLYKFGERFEFKSVMYNPNPAAADADPFGAAYTEVFSREAR